MHRLFGLLAMTAAGFGLFLLLGPDTEPASTGAKAADNAPIAYSVWALGLLMGLTLAWLAGVEWSTLPERVRGLQSRKHKYMFTMPPPAS